MTIPRRTTIPVINSIATQCHITIKILNAKYNKNTTVDFKIQYHLTLKNEKYNRNTIKIKMQYKHITINYNHNNSAKNNTYNRQ